MEPEAAERFEHIERALAGIVETQRLQAQSISQLIQLFERHVNASDARMTRIEQNIEAHIEAADARMSRIERNFEAADARMTRMEDNLELLIRAITAEHKNGKE